MSPGYVYFLHAEGTDRYKIGLTNDVERRVRDLNGKQAAFPVVLLWWIEVDDMHSAEKWLHDYFSERREHGEWFRFDFDELDCVKSAYSQAEDQFSFARAPEAQPTYYDRDNDYDSGLPWGWIAGGAVLFIGVIGSLAGGGQRSAIVQGLTNVRETPNGRIICAVPNGTKITVSESSNSQWLKTYDACDKGSGVIFKERVRVLRDGNQ